MSKIIAVWGSPNSGKSSLAVKLALSIYEHFKATVLVLHTDMVTPVLPVIFPNCKSEDLYSIGTTLSKTDITQAELLKSIIPIKEKPNLGFLGFKDGENKYTYPRFDDVKSILLLTLMRSISDYVIVDCTSDSENILSMAALSQSDTIIRLATPDLKSMSFYFSQLPLYSDPKYQCKEIIQALQIRDNDLFLPIDETEVYFKDIQFVIPYCREIKQQMLDGRLLDKIPDKKYNTTIRKIAEKVV